MPATLEEIATLRNQLIAEHGDKTLALASTMMFYWTMTKHLGPAAEINFGVLMTCMRSHMDANNIKVRQFEDALRDMERANRTLALLSQLFDD